MVRELGEPIFKPEEKPPTDKPEEKPSTETIFAQVPTGGIRGIRGIGVGDPGVKPKVSDALLEQRRKTAEQKERIDKQKDFNKELRGMTPKERSNFLRQLGKEKKLSRIQSDVLRKQAKGIVSRVDPKFLSDVTTGRAGLSSEAQRLLFGVTPPKDKEEIKVPPTATGLPPTPKEKIKRFLQRAEAKIPAVETGVVGAFGLEKKVIKEPTLKIETPTIITDVTQAPGTGGKGTLIFTQREKTFFEKFGLDPNDKDSINLKNTIDTIQLNFGVGKISEDQADKKLNEATNEFQRKVILKGVAPNAAAGIAFGLLQAIPFVGTAANILLGADFLLKRKAVVSQFKQFPKETALTSAAFIAGGLAGSKVGAGVKGKVSDIKIDPNNLDSVTQLTGAEKTKISVNAVEIFPEISALIKQNKITGTTAYKVKLKDGKSFQIIEFSKQVGNKLQKEFIGFEEAPKGFRAKPEVFVGRGVGVLEGLKGKTFIRAVKFRQASTPLGRFVQRRFSSGRLIDLVEKSQVIKQQQKGRVQARQFEVAAGILKNEAAKNKLVANTAKLIDEIKKTGRFSNLKIKQLINLERRIKGLEPFTDAEFQSTNIRTLSNVQLLKLLDRIKLSFIRVDIKGLKTIAQKKFIETKGRILGEVATKGIEIKPKLKVKVTPLKKTFARESPIVKRAKILAKSKPFSKLIQKLKTKEKIKVVETPPSVSAASLVALTPLGTRAQGFIPVPVFSGGKLSLGLSMTSPAIKNNLTLINNNIQNINSNILRLQSLTQTGFIKNSLLNLNKQKLQLKLRQNLLQKQIPLLREELILRERISQETRLSTKLALKLKLKQKLKLRQKNTSKAIQRATPTFPKIPTPIPPILKLGEPKKTKVVKKVPPKILRQGFNVFVKTKGKFKKQNINSISKKNAFSLGSLLADKSTARTFKVAPSNKPAKKPKLKIPTTYWTKNRRKFRTPIRKGIQTKKTLTTPRIERSKFAIDSRSEKKQLSVARVRAKLFKPRPPKKIKVSKSFKKKRK